MRKWLALAWRAATRYWGRIALACAAGAALSIAWWVISVATAPQVQMVAALLTPSVALLAAVIAGAQWHIARNKLKLDLFDRRYAVFAVISETMRKVAHSERITKAVVDDFLAGTQSTEWLFDHDTACFVHDLGVRLLDVNAGQNVYFDVSRTPTDEVRVRARGDMDAARTWIINERLALSSKFGDFLRLQH
jgi:hypothetical protein